MRHLITTTCASLVLLAAPLAAEQVNRVHGGDTYIAGETVAETLSATGDVFAAGSVITTSGSTSGDTHVAGYTVDISTQSAGDS